MVPVAEPVTTVRLDTPAGLVVAEVLVRDGAAEQVTIRNVPSYLARRDVEIDVPGYGRIRHDLAYGGNFYAIVDLADYQLPFDRAAKDEILAAGLATMAAINERDEPAHVLDAGIRGCHHVQFVAPGSTASHSRHAMAIHPGWFDRSPCGTGTSARMAQLHARGELALNSDFVNESFIGTRFVGRLVEETEVGGIPAVVPTVTGRAWITGTAQYFLDPADPFPAGFLL
jgi:proline racemase